MLGTKAHMIGTKCIQLMHNPFVELADGSLIWLSPFVVLDVVLSEGGLGMLPAISRDSDEIWVGGQGEQGVWISIQKQPKLSNSRQSRSALRNGPELRNHLQQQSGHCRH